MKKLKIGLLVTGHLTMPPPARIVYAPMDLVVDLINGLQKKGHEVTLYAPVGSKIPGIKIESHNLKPLKENEPDFAYDIPLDAFTWGKLIAMWDQYLMSHMFQAAIKGELDILHFNLPAESGLALAAAYPQVPVITTFHDPLDQPRADLFNLYPLKNQWYASISNNQRSIASDIQYIDTIYNGIKTNEIPFSSEPGSYLLFVGRILPQKGVAEAIQVAKKVGKNLVIIGPRYKDEKPNQYWEQEIAPHIDGKTITHIDYLPRQEVIKYYSQAEAFLFPIKWEEPFGLVMVEAMAAGTPVIGMRRGSVPEVVKDGKTGFVVDTVEQMADAVKRIPEIDRAACRQHVEENFSTERMVDNYEEAYYKILEKQTS